MMGSCSGMSSTSYRCRYVSWCVDTVESPAPATATPMGPHDFPHQNQQTANSGSVPLLLLSPPETSRGDENATFPRPRSQATYTKKKQQNHCLWNLQSSSTANNTGKVTDIHKDEGEDDSILAGREGNSRLADTPNREEPSALQPKDGNFPLRRSSPVISRHHRPRCWHVVGTDPSNPSSSDSTPPSSCSLSPDHDQSLTATNMEDLRPKSTCQGSFPVQVYEKQHCISLSSKLNHLQSDHYLHRGGQRRLTVKHRVRSQSSSNTPHTPGLSTSAPHNKERCCSAIPVFPADLFKTSCELEKENAHFIVVDMVLEVMEGAKWTLSFDQRTSTMDIHHPTHCMMCMQSRTSSQVQDSPPHRQMCETHEEAQGCSTGDAKQMSYKRRHSDEDMRMPHTDTHFSHTQGKDNEESEEAKHSSKTLSVLSTDSGFEDSGLDTTLMPTDSLRNAEWLAEQLVLEFKRRWLPSHELRCGRQSLRSSLQELPGTGVVAVSSGSLTEEIRLRTRMRGSLNWAPPRFQIIFTVQPTHRRSEVVALQHFLCAGCGTAVEPRYIKKLRYCEYLGRYFCVCCHSGSEAVIPGRVLSCWDFSRYSVSDFSKQLLDSVWHQPLFDLTSVGRTLCSKVKELDKFRELQEQLMGIKKLLKVCRLSERVLAEFEQLPAHLMEQLLVFSMDDLVRVKKGQLAPPVRAVLHSAIDHVESCQLCLARGFVCEICREKDIIFPFQSDLCKRCKVCKTCFHKHCFVEKKCPKCARIQSRTKVHLHP
ncbi:protein associated with UVRAG as autophagy enhancer [Leuresthes tenuis]|uniref:protein associated with UVRAG as autophagy enhancer n=1 Tax=Leuresthes tenuis TaxID=355514 RepID=UPI003B50C277